MTNTGTALSPPAESEVAREIRRLYPRLVLAAVRRLQRAGDWGDPEDVVHIAVLAIVRGQRPAHVPVEVFLRKKIQNVVSNAARTRTRVPERLVDDPRVLDALLADPPPDESLDQAQVSAMTFSAIIDAANATGDAEVALMVEAYRDGTTTRAEVAASLGLTTAQHDAARKRLDRLCQRLPEAVLDGVRQVFGINLRIRSGQ